MIRSTVLPGTTREFILPRLIDSSGRRPGDAFGVAFNPEFMREGFSVSDFNNPSRTIVGAIDAESTAAALSLYKHLPGVKIRTDIETAELVEVCGQHLARIEGGLHQRNCRPCEHAGS